MRRPTPQHPARPALAIAAAAALLALCPASDGAGAAPAAAAPPPSATYRLDDTLGPAPWSLAPGRYADALDASSADDGTTYVLDGDQAAVHVLAPDGRPLAVWPLAEPSDDREPVALDVGPGGRVHVLTACPSCFDATAVDRFAPDGRVEERLSFEEDYADVAVRADGRLYLVRPEEARTAPEPLPAVDVYDAAGAWLGAVRDDAMAVPIRADVAADGHVYVLHTVPQPPTPGGGGRGGRGPLPPPDPSAADPSPLQEPAEPVSGVMRFDPLHRYLGTVPFASGIDVAVRDDPAYVSAYGRVHAVGEDAPLSPVVGQRWSGRPALDVAPDGALVAALSHCSFQGVLRYARPADRPLAAHALSGALDRPALAGPALARRVHARGEGVVLQAPFAAFGVWPGTTHYDALPDEIPFTQSIQRWTADGALGGQLGHCGQPREVTHARDIARDGDDVYVIDGECLIHRPDDAFPAWSYCPQGLFEPDATTRLAAVSADAGRAAVLDLGAGAVVVVDRTGRRVAAWRIEGEGALLPSDLALRGDRVWLAGLGQPRIQSRSLDGTVVADWPALDGVRALDIGPEGDVYALGRAAWAARYAPDGAPRALWPMPRDDVEVTDLSVADDGRVWVPWARSLAGAGRAGRVAESGVWRFVAEDAPPPAGGPGACALRRDKRAAPGRLPLGGSVGVALSIDGACPGAVAPARLAIVFDTSRSMTWDYALERAKAAIIDLVAALPPDGVEALLVTFDDEPVLESPATRDFVAVARRVAALRGRGDTRMGAGIDLAVRHLQEGEPPERRVLLVVSDGVPYDATADALDRAQAAGIEVAAWLWENGEDELDAGFVQGVIARGGTVDAPPGPAALAGMAGRLVRHLPQAGLLQGGVVVDEVPANMRYVEGSARPPAAWDPAARLLSWDLPPTLAADGVRLAYRVVPLEVGRHPTNVRAEADVVDAAGAAGHLVFPVPEVEVYAPRRVFLPIALRQACVRRERPADVVLVLDTSSSMSEAAEGGGTKLDAARAAARTFVDQLDLPNDRVAVVTFDAASHVALPLTGDRAAVAGALDAIRAAQGTRIDLGLRAGRDVLAGRDGDRRPALVLLSDGLHAGDAADVVAEADALRDLGALVYGIGLGDDADLALLARVATTPDRAFHSPTAEDLVRIYAAIRERLVCDGA